MSIPDGGAPAPGAEPARAPLDTGTAATVAAGLAVVGATAIVVAIATASGGVAGVAYTLAGGCLAAAGLLVLTLALLRPVPPPPSHLPADPARALGALGRDDLELVGDQVAGHLAHLDARARELARTASGLLAAGGLLLALFMPVFWLAGDADALPAGRWGTVALLLVAIAPVAGLALCRAVMSGEWGPPAVLPADPGAGWSAASWRTEALRRTAARGMVALAVGELVVARRRRVVTVMAALVGLEAVWLVIVVLARIGRL